MQDRIINSLMDTFIENNELSKNPESHAFEEFSTYYVVSKLMDGDFSYDSIDEMQIGDGDDGGIDAIGVLINGEFFDNLQSLSDMFDSNSQRGLDARIIFVQSKTSSKFSASEMRTFGDGIVDILREQPKLRQNSRLAEKWAMLNELIEHAQLFNSIQGRAYYVTVGDWNDNDQTLAATIKTIEADVTRQNVLTSFQLLPIDSATLRQYVSDSGTKVSKKIEFTDYTDLPLVPGVEQGWNGYIKETEFIKLIVDENNDLRRSLFYDNVRDFQGDTPANMGIAETLESDKPEEMAILNNGITIIADWAQLMRKNLTLKNYQIVNGCQTSYVIYNHKESASEKVSIPVKIIVTTDSDISTKITVANNRQTAVKDEDLLALTEIQKKLEKFFETFKGDRRLYYERRSNQYNDRPEVEKVRIVPIAISLRSYCSMFMAVPHVASRWYGKLYKDYSKTVFDGTKADMAFYTAAFTLYRYNFFIRNGIFERKYGKFKYFMLLMLRAYITGNDKVPDSKKKAESECKQINEIIWNKKECQIIMKKMIDIIASVAGDEITSNKLTANKTFLETVLSEVIALSVQNNSND